VWYRKTGLPKSIEPWENYNPEFIYKLQDVPFNNTNLETDYWLFKKKPNKANE
jgi:hypothetical protein